MKKKWTWTKLKADALCLFRLDLGRKIPRDTHIVAVAFK
jgi:hypothetical protein